MRRAIGATLLVVGFLLAAVVPVLAASANTISLSASRFDFTASGGQTGVGTVWVTNEGDTTLSVRVYSANQTIDASGVAQYVQPTADANILQSPASWMGITLHAPTKLSGNIPYVVMKPHERIRTDFRVKVPLGAIPGDHNILLFFEAFLPPDQITGGATSIFGRLGARVKTRVSGTIVEKVDAVPFSMPSYVLGSAVPYSVTFTNSGNLDERITARIAQLDASDAEIDSTEVTSGTAVYSNAAVPQSGVVKSVKYGPQRFKLVLTYPSADPASVGLVKSLEKVRNVWVLPAWLPYAVLITLVIVIGLVIWVVGNRRGRRKAQRAAAEWARQEEARRQAASASNQPSGL